MAPIGKGRVESFSDGVIAIIVTIMVLELKVPQAPTFAALGAVTPTFIAYATSFFVVAVMWVNHYHLIHAVQAVTPRVLWANLNLLFWMSLIPFTTAWLGNHYLDPAPAVLYGINMVLTSLGFVWLRAELAIQDRHSARLYEHHQRLQRKAISTGSLYFIAIFAAFYSTYISEVIYAVIPALYFLPEKLERGEKADAE